MDSRVNCKEQAPKVTNHEFVGNEHTSYLSKMPAATVEQLTIAKILSKPDTDVNLRSYVAQLQELTKCSEDQAVTALYDCENDIERAVELVLDKFRCGAEEEWRTTVSKRAKAKHSQTVTDVTPETAAPPKKASRPKVEKLPENAEKTVKQNGPVPSQTSVTKSSPVSHEITRRTSNKKKAPSKLNAAASERQGESQNERDGGVVCNNSKQLPSERKPKNESEVWDPYADLGEWEGESIEIVNSNASIAMGLQDAVSLPPELFHETSNPEKDSNLESDVHVDTVQNLTKDPEALDADALFATTARSKPPPRAFTGKLDVPLFIAPELLPSSHFSWKPTFGGDSPAPKFSPVAPTLPNSGRISNEADELLREPSDPRTPRVPVEQVDCSPKQYTFPQISQQSHTNDFELKNASLGVLLEPTKTEEKMGNITSEYSPHQYSEQMISEVSISYPINQKKQTPPMVTRTASDKPSYLEPSIKNYLLDSLPDGISKLNVGDVSGQNTKDQFPVQNNTQASLPSFPHGQSDQSIIPPQLNKVPVSHPNTHVSGHTQPMNANTQAAHLPPGMPHFISQFAPPAAYHMFNLPGGSNTAPAIFDLDHLQLLQQQRMLYDIHLQHHAATTAQSMLTPNADAASAKTINHSLTNPMAHVTAANTGIRPDMLTTALSHTPQMMTPGHPYFPYSGFVLMNGYPNPFLNQQQPNSDGSQVQNPGQCASPITQHQPQTNQTQPYNSLKQLQSGVGNYEDLLDVKYGDPSKQVGFKTNSNQPGYGSFQSQGMSLDNVSGKLSSSHSNNGSLVQNFNHGSSNSHAPPHFSPQFYASVSASPYMNTVAAVVAAAAAKHGTNNSSTGNANQSNPNVGVTGGQTGGTGAGQNQIHLPGNPSQGMVLSNAGASLHHHQRAQIPHPQH
uniref:UBA-like domain-containing protein n=1 Tax=Trichobilharzia regenti TaxID=157069 RepID=A0AA85KG77_TRIRE|nr:unnamed protein product [Trichobilharzia regenti]